MSFLPQQLVPRELWHQSVLRLPSELTDIYRAVLEEEQLLAAAQSTASLGRSIGGQSAADTRKHFATRFGVSAARTEFSTLNANGGMENISDALLAALCGGEVNILDAPCGAGAASASMIATLLALRRTRTIPRFPLRIRILAADHSEEARRLCGKVLGQLQRIADEDGLSIGYECVGWDATSSYATTLLLDRWLQDQHQTLMHVVLVSAFSGALSTADTFEQFRPSLEQILARLEQRRAVVVWLEPPLRSGENLFQRLAAAVQRLLQDFLTP